MNKLHYYFLFSTLSIAACLSQCKKDTIQPFPKTETDTLAWKQFETDSIIKGDTNELMRILTIFNYEDSLLLRTKSHEVRADSNDPVLTKLVRRMYYTLKATGSGVGLAAPQVGINRDIIWLQRMDKTGKPFEYYLNLKIIMYSSKAIVYSGDGCLSIPGQSGNSHRFSSVLVEYDKLDGKHYQEIIEGYAGANFTSIIFQHETDHLNGILYIDRLNAKERIESGKKGNTISANYRM
jgi:peptide deformylase